MEAANKHTPCAAGTTSLLLPSPAPDFLPASGGGGCAYTHQGQHQLMLNGTLQLQVSWETRVRAIAQRFIHLSCGQGNKVFHSLWDGLPKKANHDPANIFVPDPQIKIHLWYKGSYVSQGFLFLLSWRGTWNTRWSQSDDTSPPCQAQALSLSGWLAS